MNTIFTRLLKILVGLVVIVVLVIMVLSFMVVDTMRPEPSAPELSTHSAVERSVRPAVAYAASDTGIFEVAEVHIYGWIRDPDGVPVERARLAQADESITVTGGRYEIWLPASYRHLGVSAPGYYSSTLDLTESMRDSGEVEYDFVLSYSDDVTVYCAGLPGDSCVDMLLSCSTPLMPMGEACHQRAGQTVCDCPDGEAAIRGGGRATLIGPEDVEAWLDFRDTGSITGRVLSSGVPVTACDVGLIRVPMGLEDVPRGLVIAQKARCSSDGRFVLPGLVSGDWELMVRVEDDYEDNSSRVLTPRRLAPGQHLDIGDVELWAGGGIEGVLYDGLTGRPTSGAVMATRQAGSDERITPMGDDADSTGRFHMDGLPPGTWRVFSLLSPHDSVLVEVEEGAITDGVVIQTSDATALKTNGFSLTQEGGRLVVDTVSAHSPAGDAGLREGDVLVGVELAGFDLTGLEGGDVDLARFVLGNWDGPGITLLVEQEGEPLEIPLDW